MKRWSPRHKWKVGTFGKADGRLPVQQEQLVTINVLEPLAPFDTYNRRFCAPAVLEVLLRS